MTRRTSASAVDVGRWPRIGFALSVRRSGSVDCDYFLVVGRMDYRKVQGVERAEVWEEMAAFYEWRLEQRADELAGDRILRHLVAKWTDSMCYSLRRSAALFRGDDPGPVIPQHERRPDLDAEGRAIVDEIVAELDHHGDYRRNGHRQLVGAGVAR